MGLNLVAISLDSSEVKKKQTNFGPISGGTPLGPLFLFFLLFFSPVFFVFFLAFSFFHVFIFLKKKVSSFLSSCISFKYVLLLAVVSEFNCFLRSQFSMEMWCPDDTGRDSWDWVGPPAWERACFIVGWRLLAVKTEPPQIVVLLLFQTRACNSKCMVTMTEPECATPVPSHLGVKLPATPAPLEPSSTHSCERLKARKTGAQLRDNRRSEKNDAKCVEKALRRHHKQQC